MILICVMAKDCLHQKEPEATEKQSWPRQESDQTGKQQDRCRPLQCRQQMRTREKRGVARQRIKQMKKLIVVSHSSRHRSNGRQIFHQRINERCQADHDANPGELSQSSVYESWRRKVELAKDSDERAG